MDWVRAVVQEVRPLPTLAAMTAGVTGMALAGGVEGWLPYVLLLGAILYVAHVKDAYVDYYVRREDQMYPWGSAPATGDLVSERGLAVMAGAALLVVVFVPAWALGGERIVFYVLVAGMLVLAVSYSGSLDTHPLGSALAYPVGVGLATVAGAVLASGRVPLDVLVYAVPLVVVLAGAKIVEDIIDAGHDEELGKRTVPVVLGPDRARRLGYGMVAAGMLPLTLISPLVAVGVLGGLGLLMVSGWRDVDRGIYPLVVGVYVAMVAVLLHAHPAL